MDRYIAAELIPPFLFGVGGFSSIGVAVGSLFDMVVKITELGLSWTIAAQVVLLKFPEFMSYALPISVLLATLIAYSRLSNDSELIALRSCGVSLYRLVAPALVLSLVVTGITFLFNELIVPAANYQATITLEKALNQEKPAFNENGILYPEYQTFPQPNGTTTQTLKRLFYANEFDGQTMKDLTVLEWSNLGKLNKIILSESALWNSTQNTWDFFHGSIYFISPNTSFQKIVTFDHQEIPFPRAPLDLVTKARDPYEMNILQAIEMIQLLQGAGDRKKLRMLQVRMQQKIAFPFICIIFGLVGASISIRPKRISKGTSFGVCLIVIFGYYLLSFVIGGFGIAGILSPIVAAWLPNLFGFGAGGWLLWRLEANG
ncbi:MAG: YjgP/YjgQ family permease [Moorea sp. SIO3B2]|nr:MULTISPECIES: LptF/LptG family permease [unclassified Moorena]NEP33832.1 YjgP/YjgQ family permease [Moorena sp. SIO3B2]NES42539.1 YjgP/YjgQ family permease [Moorena sp. SIO2C4]